MNRGLIATFPVLFLFGIAVAGAGPALSTPSTAPSTAPSSGVTKAAAPTASVSPSPGAAFAEPATSISFQGLPTKALTGIVATGSVTGTHRGRVVGYSNGNGGSFVPAKSFAPGEKVTVTTPFGIKGARGKSFSFTVATPAVQPLTPLPMAPPAKTQSFVSAADLHPAAHTVTGNGGAIPGDTFLTPNGPVGLNGLEIDDAGGNVVYYHPTPDYVGNFRVQKLNGQPVLTWWEGAGATPGYGRGSYYIADTSYRVIKHFTAGNGLVGDLHEFTITPQGTALISAYPAVQADDSALTNGSTTGDVLDGVVQEIDLKTGAVMFEWHALDHITIADTYANLTTPAATVLDPIHLNSIQPYGSGQLLVSLRDLHQLVTFSRTTGVVDLRIGGLHPNVSEPAEAFTQSQHDAEPHSDGTITVFDNGAGVGVDQHPTSRGLVLRVSGRNVSVKTVLTPPNGELAYNQGSVQDLNGGYLVDYGPGGSVVLYNSTGGVLSVTRYQKNTQSYRAFKTVWHAMPTTGPTLSATLNPSSTTVNVSWNGATEVASWRILGGVDAAHLATVATVAKTGFETTVPVAATSGLLIGQALDVNGKTLGASTPLTIG